MPATMSPARRDLDVLAVVGVHQQDAADALLAILRRVVDLAALLELARVDAEVGELAELVGDDLEREGGERRGLVGRTLEHLEALDVDARRDGKIERRRQEVDDRVEHRLDALVLERGAAEHRHEREVDGALADGRLDLLRVDLLVAEVLLHEVVVVARDDVEELRAPLVRLALELGRDVGLFPVLAHALVPDLAFMVTRSTMPR